MQRRRPLAGHIYTMTPAGAPSPLVISHDKIW